MAIKTFKRNELKYLITPEQYELLTTAFADKMVLDKFCKKGSYMIYNIYFDTENNDIIRHSVSKPYFKEKLRMRSYKTLETQEDMVFLELKKKIGSVVAKRRATMPYHTAMEFVKTGVIPGTENYQDNQVCHEIADFLNRYNVSPKVFISYKRTAFFDKQDKELRISFDSNIIARRENVNLTDGNFGEPIIGNNSVLMEVKCLGVVPLWLSAIFTQLGIKRVSFSKYGTEYKKFIQNKYRLYAA